jgi:hypothetical protein
MNPIQAPHYEGAEVKCVAAPPILVNIVAHFLDQFGDLMGTYGTVFAAPNFYICGPPIAGVRADPRVRFDSGAGDETGVIETADPGGENIRPFPQQHQIDEDRS